MAIQMMIVEPDQRRWRAIRSSVGGRAIAEFHADFVTARASLAVQKPNLLLTNLRLGAYNGLHLVYLLRALDAPTRAFVYGEPEDVSLGLEAQTIGAFYIVGSQVTTALPGIVSAALPSRDRRDLSCPDRRRLPRGGRRATDLRLVSRTPAPAWGRRPLKAEHV